MNQIKFFVNVTDKKNQKLQWDIARLEESIEKYEMCYNEDRDQLQKLEYYLKPQDYEDGEEYKEWKDYWEYEDCKDYWTAIRVEALQDRVVFLHSEIVAKKKSLVILRKIESELSIFSQEQDLLEKHDQLQEYHDNISQSSGLTLA